MFNIPHEIWMHITSFLSKDEIWALRLLNSNLREIAMNMRYKTLQISMTFSGSKHYIRDFLRFRDEDIAKRIRHISYYPYATTTFPEEPKPTKSGIINRRLKTLFNDNNQHNDFVAIIAGFTNLSSLEIRCVSILEKQFRECIPLFHTNFQTCFPHLQSLLFHFPIEYFSAVIPPDLFLPHLLSFSVIFCISKTSDDFKASFKEIAMTTIVPFLNRHRRTITTLDLALDRDIDITSLFLGIDHITSLRSAAISISSSTEPSSIARFLELHRENLEKINITLCGSPTLGIDGVFEIISLSFPELKYFSVQFPRGAFPYSPPDETNLGPMADFIKRSSTSLLSLDIFNNRQSQDSLFALLDSKSSPDISFSKLKYLYLTIQSLTPDILDFLSSHLPDLKTLKLCAFALKSRKSMPNAVNDEYQFCLEIDRRNYSKWKLEHLTVLLGDPSPFARTTLGRVAIARAIPSLKTFNDAPLAEKV